MVQWLRLHTYTAGDMGSIPGGGTKILHATWYGQKKGKRSRSGDTVKKSTKGVTRVPKGEETGNRAEVILRGKNENFQI